MITPKTKRKTLTFLAIVLAFFVFGLISFSSFLSIGAMEYDRSDLSASVNLATSTVPTSTSEELSIPKVVITHIKTPTPVKAIYMSSWVAGTKGVREKLIKRIEGTEINSIVIDVKDSSGKIVVKLNAPALAKYNSFDSRVPDITEFVDELHQKGYYVIGRISVFEDNYLSRQRPDLALRRKDNNEIWVNNKGLAWLDVSQTEVWDYAIAVAREAYAVGFDEINFDYVRFPTDGDVSQIRYRNYDPIKETKSEALKKFFVYLHNHLADIGAPISANIFGMVTTNIDDLGIGQVLEDIAKNVDYVSPMVYPSHYPPNWNGYKNPATVPYEVVSYSMNSAVKRLEAQGISRNKLRPWLQDFNMGATYTASMINAQKKATYDAGLDSWMMWDPSNKYTIGAYQK